MKVSKLPVRGILAGFAMLVLILDSRTALQSASSAVDICLKTVIPSLFPFFVLSAMMTDAFRDLNFPFLKPLSRLVGIPKGTEHILMIGFLGGYPVGAQCISQAYSSGQISRTDAQRMLGFCSNAGPAFLFGMMSRLFSKPITPFILWGIHIVSALIVGMILPWRSRETAISIISQRDCKKSNILRHSIAVIAEVCGWIILFRVLLSFMQQWFFKYLPVEGQILISGITELANGCISLNQIEQEKVRFLYASLFLGLGGVCVGMQTWSVTGNANLNTGLYFPGKLLQAGISVILSLLIAPVLFPDAFQLVKQGIVLMIPLFTVPAVFLAISTKKNNSSISIRSGV